MNKKKYYLNSIEDIYVELKTSELGLSIKEAKKRLEKYGKNKLEEKKKDSNLKKFINQFNDMMIIILIISAIISFVISKMNNESISDSIIILAIVLLNAILGYIQERKADKSIEALQKLSVPHIKVRRDNKVISINIEDLVIGDVMLLESGDYVPADARVIKSSSVQVDESSLTGESVAVEKKVEDLEKELSISEISNMVFAGSTIVYGHCEAIVVETGMNTILGSIAESLSQEEQMLTPLQMKIEEISKVISIIIGIIILIMFIIGILKGNDLLETIMLAISLAVAAIPEGLPAVITITLSLGMGIMAKKNAIIRKMSSVETLGSTEIICSDKTGTITQNKMTVRSVIMNKKKYEINADEVKNNKMIINAMVLCNDVIKDDDYLGDPTEIALYKYAEDLGYNPQDINEQHPRINEIPFDAERKMMSTLNILDNKQLLFTKGSLDSILNYSTKILINGKVFPFTNILKKEIKKIEIEESGKALRLLAFAYKDKVKNLDEDNLIFIGLIGMMDPPREQVKDAIKLCYQAGIKPIMITGDSLSTATAIAKEIGIASSKKEVIEGKELDKYTDEQLKEVVKKYNVYARVSPEHKLRIVKAWQSNQKIVAMTGDGVNDAPAIKSANIGIGMGITGTEVSKNVSDVVLADDCFNTIVTAVQEGRRIFDNIRNVIIYLLTGNIAEVLIVFVTLLTGSEIFLPIQLLYINLITDSIPAIALAFEKESSDIMTRQVRDMSKPFFTSFVISRMIISSMFKTFILLIMYYAGLKLYGPSIAATVAFLGLTISEMLFAVSCKNIKKNVLNKSLFNNKTLNISMIILTIIQVLVFTTPIKSIFNIEYLNIIQVVYVIALCLLLFLCDELSKSLAVKLFKD